MTEHKLLHIYCKNVRAQHVCWFTYVKAVSVLYEALIDCGELHYVQIVIVKNVYNNKY